MTEREKNSIVAKELFGDKEFSDEVIENRLIDWDKAWTCIYYNKQSHAMEERGESVYLNIRERNEEFLEQFKKRLLQISEI